jgi:hypothetical protein
MSDEKKHVEIDHALLKEHDSILFHVASPLTFKIEKLDDNNDPVFDDNGKPVMVTEFVRNKNGKIRCGTPTHTLAFAKVENTIVMAYSQARVPLDSYSRQDGTDIVKQRLTTTINRLKNSKRTSLGLEILDKELVDVLPYKVVHNLDYYVNKVARHYKLTGDEILFFRGDKRINSYTFSPIFTEEPQEETQENVMHTQLNNYIFCTRTIDDGNDGRVEILINHKDEFDTNGVSLEMNSMMIADLNEIIDSHELYNDDDKSCILYHNSLSEPDLVEVLEEYGINHSEELESAYSEITNL